MCFLRRGGIEPRQIHHALTHRSQAKWVNKADGITVGIGVEILSSRKPRRVRINEPAQIQIGDQIRLHNPVTKPGLKTKLRKDLWKGPFTVVNTNNLGNVQLNMNNKLVWHHKNRVKLAEDKRNKYISRYGRETKLINYKE